MYPEINLPKCYLYLFFNFCVSFLLFQNFVEVPRFFFFFFIGSSLNEAVTDAIICFLGPLLRTWAGCLGDSLAYILCLYFLDLRESDWCANPQPENFISLVCCNFCPTGQIFGVSCYDGILGGLLFWMQMISLCLVSHSLW